MKTSVFSASIGFLVTVAVFDYATGYELLVHIFFFSKSDRLLGKGGSLLRAFCPLPGKYDAALDSLPNR